LQVIELMQNHRQISTTLIYPSNLKMQDSVGIKSVLDKANA